MKTGRSLQEVMIELDRQSKAKRDFIGQAETFHLREDGKTFEINHMLRASRRSLGRPNCSTGRLPPLLGYLPGITI